MVILPRATLGSRRTRRQRTAGLDSSCLHRPENRKRMPPTSTTESPAGSRRGGSAAAETTSAALEQHGHGDIDVDELPMTVVHAHRSFFRGFGEDVRDIWSYRELLSQL